MGYLPLKYLVLLHISIILFSSLNVLGSSIAQTPEHLPTTQPPAQAPQYHHPHHPPVQPPSQPSPKQQVQPPSHAPVQAPSHAPVQAPSHAPVQAPSHAPSHLPPRKFVAVQGVVYCKDCKHAGSHTLLGANPLPGAVVRLQCNNTRTPLVLLTKTDQNGYFFITGPNNLSNYGAHKCKVSVISSPDSKCDKPTDFNNGLSGANLYQFNQPPISTHPVGFDLFNVGPFAFEPSSKVSCPH